jgi:hypothetical protein
MLKIPNGFRAQSARLFLSFPPALGAPGRPRFGAPVIAKDHSRSFHFAQ